MFIDLHMHEKRYSLDSTLALEEIVEIAKKEGWMQFASRTMTVWDFANTRKNIVKRQVFPSL